MAKLYWRHKKNGKWTWTAAEVVDMARFIKQDKRYYIDVEVLEPEGMNIDYGAWG
jgi:hypothetical protein